MCHSPWAFMLLRPAWVFESSSPLYGSTICKVTCKRNLFSFFWDFDHMEATLPSLCECGARDPGFMGCEHSECKMSFPHRDYHLVTVQPTYCNHLHGFHNWDSVYTDPQTTLYHTFISGHKGVCIFSWQLLIDVLLPSIDSDKFHCQLGCSAGQYDQYQGDQGAGKRLSFHCHVVCGWRCQLDNRSEHVS